MIAPLSPAYFRAVAEAHVALDPTAFLSEIKELGVVFRERIFYPTLVNDPDSFVWIALIHDSLAGYIVGTKNTEGFCDRLLRSHPFLLLALLVKAALRKPQLALKYALNLKGLKRALTSDGIRAEIISLGVLPQYRAVEFERSAGIHVGRELFKKAVDSFQKSGVGRFKVMTIQDNNAANRFYEKQGLQRRGEIRPFGLPCNLYVGDTSKILETTR